MVEENILIKIQAINEASAKINEVSNSLKQLTKFEIPQLDLGEIKGINKVKVSMSGLGKEIDPALQAVKEFQAKISRMDVEPIERLDQTLGMAGVTSEQFTKFLAQNNLELIKGVGVYDRLSGAILTQGQAVKLATIDMRRFKFEWLSILFAGMALDRVFGSLVDTQLQLFGVTELLSSAWTIVLLPIMELLTPLLYTLIEGFMAMPDSMKLIVGGVVLFVAAIGKILSVGGQIMLFFMALKSFGITSFASLKLAVAPFISALLPIIAVLSGVALAIAGVYLIVKQKFEGIGLIITGIGVILALFIGWWAAIPIAVGAAVYLIIKYWDNIKKWFSSFFSWVVSSFLSVWDKIKKSASTVGSFFISIWEKVKDKFGLVGKFFSKVWDGIKNTFKGAINFLISVMNSGISGLEKMINTSIKGLNHMIKLMNKIPGINIKTIGEVRLPKIPSFQTGGVMPYTGLAYLHAGERIIPRNESRTVNYSPTINLNATVSSDYDVRKLATQLNEYWARELQRR